MYRSSNAPLIARIVDLLSWAMLSGLLHGNPRIVIRLAAVGIDGAGDQAVDFRPKRLQRAHGDRLDAATSGMYTGFGAQADPIATAQTEARGVFGGHEDFVAMRTGKRVGTGIEDGIELVTAAGRHAKTNPP